MMRFPAADPYANPANIEEIPTRDYGGDYLNTRNHFPAPPENLGGYPGNINVKYSTPNGDIDMHVRPSVYKVEFPLMPKHIRDKHEIFYIPEGENTYAAEACIQQQMYQPPAVFQAESDNHASEVGTTYPDTNVPCRETISSYLENFSDLDSVECTATTVSDVDPKLGNLWTKTQLIEKEFNAEDLNTLTNALMQTEQEISTTLTNDLEDLHTQQITDCTEKKSDTPKRSNPFNHPVDGSKRSFMNPVSKSPSSSKHIPDSPFFPNEINTHMGVDNSIKLTSKRVTWMKLNLEFENSEVHEIDEDDIVSSIDIDRDGDGSKTDDSNYTDDDDRTDNTDEDKYDVPEDIDIIGEDDQTSS